MKRLQLHLWLLIVCSALYACTKDEAGMDEEPQPGTPTETAAMQAERTLMDSTYYYTYLFSLWNKPSMPEPRLSTDLRNFTQGYSDAEGVLTALMGLTPRIGPNGTPVDRFSFIDRARRVGEEIGQGLHRDIGLSLMAAYISEGSNEVGIFVRLVQKNSPAQQAGIRRGHRILSVDGERLSLTANASNGIVGNLDVANKLYSGNVNQVGLYDANDNRSYEVNVTAGASYVLDPILESKVISLEGVSKKVGYLAYTSFVSVRTNGQPNRFYQDLQNVFARFSQEGIDELVVDLRYNGGGSTNAAEHLTNLIVPVAGNGRIMYKYAVNSILADWGWTDAKDANAPFKPVSIAKTNALNISRVYFLGTSSTASASELVMNALRPYMDVEIVTTGNRGTYGKPVGSFGWSVANRAADLYITSFEMVNANDQGGYFNGLIGQKRDARDYLSYPLGDVGEGMLNEALYHIENGAYRSSTATLAQARLSRDGSSAAVQPRTINVHLDQNIQGLYVLPSESGQLRTPKLVHE